jgi:Ca2+-binding RTX toxin-like protein
MDSVPGAAIALDAVNGTSGNDTIYGTALNETFDGGARNDYLYGREGDDTLSGGTGNDQLIGGTGADTMDGGAGNDVYFVDNAGDVVVELAGEGVDVLYTDVDFSLAGDQEIEFLRASAGMTGLTLGGNDLANRIYGAAGNDTLIGGGGNDRLIGGAGADVMTGGAGNDRYYVDMTADQVFEATSGGLDSVYASVDFTLASGQEIETLRANAGAVGLTLTGNDFSNKLFGAAGNDTLFGGGANDRLVGGAGADAMSGGLGNDVYFVDDAGDVVTELAGQGSDSIHTSIDLTLAAGQEIEFLRAYADATGLVLGGNDFDNRIYGAGGNDTLSGGGGADRLYGGAGNDTLNGGHGDDRLHGGAGEDQLTGSDGRDSFVFDTPLDGSTNVDTIVDYVAADDLIRLNQTTFGGLGTGYLSASAFALDNATGSAAQIVYNTTTGALSYDSNGALAGGATQFAVLQGAPTLNANEFFIV